MYSSRSLIASCSLAYSATTSSGRCRSRSRRVDSVATFARPSARPSASCCSRNSKVARHSGSPYATSSCSAVRVSALSFASSRYFLAYSSCSERQVTLRFPRPSSTSRTSWCTCAVSSRTCQASSSSVCRSSRSDSSDAATVSARTSLVASSPASQSSLASSRQSRAQSASSSAVRRSSLAASAAPTAAASSPFPSRRASRRASSSSASSIAASAAVSEPGDGAAWLPTLLVYDGVARVPAAGVTSPT
mmetsp:Transcript_13961/g.35336  ORF Transcript_13961/g.35336 Transcript_13961/m.35336 type:complete len:248 (+) Transcript_13961:435-1178(+)